MTRENTDNAILITGTADNDSIINFGDDVTIDSGAGNDTVYSGLDNQKADRVSINAGEGDNIISIQGGSDSVTIRTGNGNNLIGTTSPNNAIFSGAGNDSVVFYTGSDNNTVETGDGDDVIDAVGHNVTINAGAGNDIIHTYRNAYDITIKPGTGDDAITLSGPVDEDHTNIVQYAEGDGNDTITAFSATDTLQITSGSISGAELVGNNVEITVGSGKITLVEANNMNINILDADGILHKTIFSGGSSEDTVVNDTLIVGTEGDDYLTNDKGKNVTINALGGNDTIENTGDNSIIDAGSGNDIVSVAGASFVTIRTGEGNNTVYSDGNGASEVIYFGNGENSIVTSNRNSTIICGAGSIGITLHNGSFGSSVRASTGNDTIAVGHYDITVDAADGNDLINLYRDAENSLIIMGNGNDTVAVYNNTHAQTFQYSSGNDLITGFDANDTLRIVGHAVSSSIISEGNLVLGLGDGSLTLAGVSSVESLNVEFPAKWSTLDGGGWEYYSVVQKDLLGNKRNDKAAQFSISGGNLKDENEDGIPDNVSIGSIIYIQQSGVHTNVNHLSGNVIYNGDALGIEGDDDYNIEAISPIDTSEKFPYDVYITDPNVTAIRGVSNGATISPRGTAGTETAADWISIDSTDSKVIFMDGAYCVYTENIFSSRDYTKLTIANSNNGVEVSTADDLIQTIGNLADGYEITIESGINVGEKINFETSGNGVIVVKTTANTGKYSLDADSDEWQYQRFSINGGDADFTFVFGENGSVVGMEDFDGILQASDNSLIKGQWVTLASGRFEYTGTAINNPSKRATFTVSGESLTSTDNLSVTANFYDAAQDGNRIRLLGLNGNASIDNVEIGVDGDTMYSAHFTKADGEIKNVAVVNISDGASVNNNYNAGVDENGLIKFSDGLHTIFTDEYMRLQDPTMIGVENGGEGFELNVSDGIFTEISGLNNGYEVSINAGGNISDSLAIHSDGKQGTISVQSGEVSETFKVNGDKEFGLKFNDDSIELVGYEGWTTIDGGFVYHGTASNDPSKTADVSLIGSELKDSDGDGAPDNIKVEAFSYSNVVGVMGFMSGFSGEVTLNNKAVGVIGDDDYEIHFTAKLIDNPTDAAKRYAEMKEVRGISDGATVNATPNDIVGLDDNAKVHMGDVEIFNFYNKNHKSDDSPHAVIGIANNNAGADLTVKDGLLTEIGGLNDGYSVSITASNNISNELKFNDVGSGSLKFTTNIDDTFTVNFSGTNSAQSITGTGNALKIIGSSGDDLLKAGATNITLTGGKGFDTFRGSAGLTNCVITDYTEGEDVIYYELSFADLSINGSISGNDYVFAADGKTITIKDGADKIIEGVDVNGDSRFFGKYLTLDDKAPATVTAQSGVAIIDAGLRTEDIVINGNSGNNTIISSLGNGTLSGGSGSDLFVYNAGDDVITDYTSGDKISIGAAISKATVSGMDVVFTLGKGSLTVKNAAGKSLSLIDSSGEEYSIKLRNTEQIINDCTGKNIDVLNKIFVTDAKELDTLNTAKTSVLEISNSQEVNLSKFDNPQIVSLEGGNQDVQFNDENGNVAVVGNNATGQKNIIFGKGDDLGIFYSPNANICVTVGSGRDSIFNDNNARVRVDMTNSNEAKIIPYSGSIILDNYNPYSRAEIVIPNVIDITGAIKDNSIQLVGNEVRPNFSTNVKLNDSDNSNIINLSTEQGDTQKVGFTGINGGVIDTHDLRENLLLKGNYAENSSDKQSGNPSTLISGNGHDTFLAGAGDFIDGGNGRNEIFLTPYDLRQIKDGATIAASGNGRNTVHDFHEGFGYEGDVIQVDDFNNLKFKFENDGLLLNASDSRIKFNGMGIDSATTADSMNSLGTAGAELIQITNGSSTMRAAVAQTNKSILVQEDDYITPNAFFGNRSGLNFSEYSDSVEINLADGTGKIGTSDATFKGINKLQAGDGMSTLIGDDNINTLIAGTGYTSIWGGAGNDKLIGKGNSADKEGRTTFFFFAGDGHDVISDFTFLTPDNRYDGIDDKIDVGDSNINNAYRAGNNVVLVFDQDSYLILEDAVGKDFRIADMIAKVDRNIAYDDLANYYVASGGSSLTVDSSVDRAEIWLDNSHGTQFFGNIRTLDASAVEGNTSLVGNEFDDTIIAGQGNSSLWGGFASSNDLLIGGNSRNTFFYCMGNGNDTIQAVNDGDFVILSDISLDQIISTNITAGAVSINFIDGGSLEINGFADVTYQIADGSKFSANHENLNWDSK